MYNDETYDIFVASCTEHLDRIEEGILDAERAGNLSRYYNAIFRGLHTVKGDAKSFGNIRAESLAHRMEDTLQELNQRSTPPTKQEFSALLKGVDYIRDEIV